MGGRVARNWLRAGHEVSALTRSDARAKQLAAQGITPIVGDVTDPSTLIHLPESDTVLFAVGYDRSAGVAIGDVYVNGLRNVLDALPAAVGRFIYISSTGVYGQTEGEWVDEDSPCEPTREGGRACLEAEQLLAESTFAERVIVLRLAGIYGPGRVPRRDDVLSGRPIPAPSRGYLNLIHVNDAADIVVAAEQSAHPPRTFNVADGCPVFRRHYYRELASLYAAPAPQFSEPRGEASAAQRASTDKRISNRRLMDELEVTLAYPSYREGLAAIVADESKD